MRRPYEFARVQLTRFRPARGVLRTASMRSACCTARKDRNAYATTQLPTTNQAGYSFSANEFTAVGAVQLSPAEAVLSAMKLPKKGGAWLSGEAV